MFYDVATFRDFYLITSYLATTGVAKLTNNSISGRIPNTWTNTSLLESFRVSDNELTGSLPSTLSNALRLEKLYVSRNLLSGSIPQSFYKMRHLQDFYIDGNNLVGSLSELDEQFYIGIQKFVINDNAFEGRFPVERFENTEILSK